MNIIKIVTIAAAIIGTIAQLGFYTQAYRILKSKTSESVSIITYFLFLSNILIWFAYGIVTFQKAIIIPNIVAIIGCLLVIVLYYKYKHQHDSCHNYGKLIGSKTNYKVLKLKKISIE